MCSWTSRRNAWRLVGLLLGVSGVLSPGARADFIPITQPDAAYVSSTTLLPITATDFSAVSSLSAGSFTASFDVVLVALTVPNTWSSWGSPPHVESSTPRVLWTNGFSSLTLTLSNPAQIFGLEVQPNTQVDSPVLAAFYRGADLIGEIALNVDGNAGARLFAASSSTLFDRIVLSSTDDFAVAQLRFSLPAPVPEPGLLPKLIGLGVVGFSLASIRTRGLRLPSLA
jgi:hypothetical protein